MDTFNDLPLELKLYTIELSPKDFRELIFADKNIYTYYTSDAGKNWFNRVYNIKYINTAFEKGITILNDLKHGEWRYYTNFLSKSEMYKFGVLHGTSYTYQENGFVISEKTYVDGLLEGVVKDYFPDGVIAHTATYKNNKKNSLDILYSANGKIKMSSIYDNGTLVSSTTNVESGYKRVEVYNKNKTIVTIYNVDNKIKSISAYKHGKLHGIKKEYEKGVLKSTEVYVNGRHVGPDILYYHSGEIKQINNYTSEDDFIIEDYYKNQNVKRKSEYTNGELNGPYIEYYKDGTIQYSASYSDGLLHGPEMTYSETGQLLT